jgi:hypothetical protein
VGDRGPPPQLEHRSALVRVLQDVDPVLLVNKAQDLGTTK